MALISALLQEQKKEVCYIPVIMDKSGVNELVYNDFFIGDDCDVTIVAGCGIHNCGNADSEHDGIHAFYIGKNSKVKIFRKTLWFWRW